MKTLGLRMLAVFFLIAGGTAVRGQERDAEVPGDYFSLEGALELFKKSSSPEEFERMLNDEDSKVNNLDLNGDGDIDYLRVIDRTNRNVHTFTIQAVISDTELQDVAVIELEKLANGKAVLQITGDEDIYGTETIIEPTQEVSVNAGTTTTTTVVNVWTWPAVQYVYDPYYSPWVSPSGWYSRPIWWVSWRPVGYYHYYSWWNPYRPYYTRCHTHRVVYADHIYRPHRSTSVIVTNRHRGQLTDYRATHRADVRHNRYDNNSNRSRSDYRSDNARPTVRTRDNSDYVSTRPTRTRNENMDSQTRYEAPTNRRSSDDSRKRTFERQESGRQQPVVTRERSSERRSFESSRQSQNRSTGSVSRPTQQRSSAPVMRQERSHSSGGGGGSKPSSHGRSRRSR